MKCLLILFVITSLQACNRVTVMRIEEEAYSVALPGVWIRQPQNDPNLVQFIRKDQNAQVTIRTYYADKPQSDQEIQKALLRLNEHYRTAETLASKGTILSDNSFGQSGHIYTLLFTGQENTRCLANFMFGAPNYCVIFYIELMNSNLQQLKDLSRQIINRVTLKG